MADNLEDIKRKITAMLAKANNTAVTEAEAEAFNKKAHELMAKYNIARSELESEKEVERVHLTLDVQLRPWSTYVLAGITKLYYCKYFSQKLDAKGRQHRITIIGEKQNAAVCHAIAVMVLRSIQTAARQAGDGRSFMTGAGMTVHQRCMEMYAAAHSTLPSATANMSEAARLEHQRDAKALTILETKEQDGNALYIQQNMGVKLGVRRSTGAKVSNLDSFGRGVAHRKSVQLRRNLLG